MWEVKKKRVYRTHTGAHEAKYTLNRLNDGYKYSIVLLKNGRKQKKPITKDEEKEKCYSWMIERKQIKSIKSKPSFGSIPKSVHNVPKVTFSITADTPSNLEAGFLYRLKPIDLALVIQYAIENPDCRVVVQPWSGVWAYKGNHMRKLSMRDMRG